MEYLNFIFRDIWTFLGSYIILTGVLRGIYYIILAVKGNSNDNQI